VGGFVGIRRYLANIERVRVRGAEFDAVYAPNAFLDAHVSGAFTDGRYVSYKNGPCPLERIASATTACDLSRRPLSGLPSSVWSFGGEARKPVLIGRWKGEIFAHAEATLRTHAYGDPTDSAYTLMPGFGLVNGSVGFRASKGWEVDLWARNLTNAHYLQNITVQAGNSGLVLGTPGDPVTIGATVRARL
jgi:iron complex outermembrane receptor protein